MLQLSHGGSHRFESDNNQAFRGTQGCRWFGQAGQALRLLKIKVVPRVTGDKVTGERCFAVLTRSEDGDGTAATKAVRARAISALRSITIERSHHEYPACDTGFSWWHKLGVGVRYGFRTALSAGTWGAGDFPLPTRSGMTQRPSHRWIR